MVLLKERLEKKSGKKMAKFRSALPALLAETYTSSGKFVPIERKQTPRVIQCNQTHPSVSFSDFYFLLQL